FVRVRLVMETHEDALLVPKDAVIEENARTYVFVARRKEPGPENAEPEKTDGSALQDETEDESAEAADTTSNTTDQSAFTQNEEENKPYWVAERLEVETGLEDSQHSEIVKGIDAEDLVVTVGQHTLKPGTRVSITTADEVLAENANLSAQEALRAAEEAKKNKEHPGGQRSRHRRMP
ncbi:MAG: hypothetical protein R6U98_17930, partial [Pirellulaceae bacterium]